MNRSKPAKVGILYIATGRYIAFWKDFFLSSEHFFLREENFEKHYYVFTDANNFEYQDNERVHRVNQNALRWPLITLNRFSIFQKARPAIEATEYLYFFNANMVFVAPVGEEILPSEHKPLVLVKHPGYYNKNRTCFPYETDLRSTAAIVRTDGKHYFMGGLNGGITTSYLAMINHLESRVAMDNDNGIIAIWHDESHLNRYAVDTSIRIKVLGPEYGFPEDWNLPFNPKIMIRDKRKHGGHRYLRNEDFSMLELIRRICKW